ncbi:MAG: 16S rRNA (guanine(527)-N(7))-methyltransferase RsmG [Alphaproteobacteria bacterium]|nr:16S rRNA (guanine(527)-N(7))-methyltransferase RsmG [Alphaproteobacteria bacterium]
MVDANKNALLSHYHVSRESLKALDTYVGLLTFWQRRVNLIGPSTVDQIWSRHILDAAQLLPLLPAGTSRIADLGTGAGIPGLILALLGPYDVYLYESNGKKVAFLREAIRVTGARATVMQMRLEALTAATALPDVDVVVSRALAPLDRLLSYASVFLGRGAIGLFHKGQDVDSELTEATKYWRINLIKHLSVTDSRGVILEVREAVRV